MGRRKRGRKGGEIEEKRVGCKTAQVEEKNKWEEGKRRERFEKNTIRKEGRWCEKKGEPGGQVAFRWGKKSGQESQAEREGPRRTEAEMRGQQWMR